MKSEKEELYDDLFISFWVNCFYDFDEEIFKILLRVCESKEDGEYIVYREEESISDFENPELNFVWGVLVLMFGDYGCAPRVGWLENSKKLRDFLKRVIKIMEVGYDTEC